MNPRLNRRAYMLIEFLVYIGLLAMFVGVAYSAYFRCQQNWRDLNRYSDDIVRAMKAGERWREDVRMAVSLPKLTEDGATLEIPNHSGTVVYRFTNGTLARDAGKGTVTVLKGVKSSRMLRDVREHVTSWRWELELASPQKVVRIRPLFSFQSVTTATQ